MAQDERSRVFQLRLPPIGVSGLARLHPGHSRAEILLLIYILLGLLAVAAIIIVALPFLLWRALAHDAARDDTATASSPSRAPSFYDQGIWRAFLSWRRERPAQLEHRPKR